MNIPDNFYDLQQSNQTDPPLVNIEEVTYKVSSVATYCTRPEKKMIDTIVFHHSETRNTDTAIDINNYHLQRGTPKDPWYMVAYSFLINAPYPGKSTPETIVSYGRPLNIVGAHAGTNVFVPMDEVQKEAWDKGEIKCGRGETWKIDPTMVKAGKIKANVTTIGVVVIGNYAKFSGKYIKVRGKTKLNPAPNLNGFLPAMEPSENLIDKFARLSCQLQKDYPRMTRIAYHAQYHSTSCPGTIDQYMLAIQTKAKEYGCDFKIIPGKYY